MKQVHYLFPVPFFLFMIFNEMNVHENFSLCYFLAYFCQILGSYMFLEFLILSVIPGKLVQYHGPVMPHMAT